MEEVKYVTSTHFNDMPIDSRLKDNLNTMGFKQPTKIQEDTLSALLAGRNLLGIANTGTGKTGAFLIPIIENLLNSERPFRSLIMVPTRELALQVEQEFKKLSSGLGLFSVSLIGGGSIQKDLKKLRKFNHLIIATPGRLMDHMQRGSLHLRDVPVLVLDEFDRMLDMGFVNDIKKIIATMKSRKQTMLFSATVENKQKQHINDLLDNPVSVKVDNGNSTSDNVEQDVVYIPRDMNKFETLLEMVDNQEFEKVLIFAETKRLVSKVSKKLNDSGMKSDQIHGNKSQNYRINALRKFKNGNIKVLVATDVAARGIDVDGVTHVINYELPINYEDYIHRIGRTGRAGKTGKAFTFVDA